MKNRLEMKTILLTGATGFLGSYLLKKLANYDYKILVLKRSFSDTTRINDVINNYNIETYDCDKINIEKVFEQHKIDAIIHCATEYGRENSSEEKIKETNINFPSKLLNLATKYNTELFINTDSYFTKSNTLYLEKYTQSKKDFYKILEKSSKNIKIINMRLEHIFGYYDNNNKFVKSIFNKIVVEKANSIDLTFGEQKRDFIYIDDVVDSYLKALEYGFLNNFEIKDFEIGTGKSISVRQFVEYINKKNKSEKYCSLNFGKIPYRENEIMESKADIENHKILGFNPKYSYQKGIDLMFEEYKKELLKCL